MRSGELLIDARNTWAAYAVDRGERARCAGGSAAGAAASSSAPERVTAYQHDAREQPNGNITFFDNGATPKVHPQSRAIELALDTHAMTATLVRRDEHSPALVAGSQGNMQTLAGGNWVVGWGQSPWLTEYSPSGQVLFDAHMPASYESYRVYRQAWSARPATPAALRARALRVARDRLRELERGHRRGELAGAGRELAAGARPVPARRRAPASRPRSRSRRRRRRAAGCRCRRSTLAAPFSALPSPRKG